MLISKFVLDHIGSIEHEEHDFSGAKVIVIEGPNGKGKTIRLKTLRSLLTIPKKGQNFSGLLGEDASQGYAYITLTTGLKIRRDLSPIDSPLSASSKATGELKGPKANTFVSGTFDAESVNCEAFLTKDPKERRDLILQAIPFDMDKKALSDIAEEDCTHYDGHPLEIIDLVHKKIYTERTEINRSAKERRQMAEGLADTIKSEVNIVTANSDMLNAERALAQLEDDRKEKIETVEIQVSKSVTEVTDLSRERVEQEQKEHDVLVAKETARIGAEIKALQDALNASIASADQLLARVKSETKDAVQAARDHARNQIDAVRSEADAIYEDKSRALQIEIADLRNTRDGEVAAEAQRKIMREGLQSAALLEERSGELTAKLEKIDEFKGNLLKELPIPGISMEDGQIFIDGKPEDQVPDSRRVKLAIDLGIARSHESSILLLDKAEAIDDDSFENTILPHLQRSGRQCFVARATVNTPDGELRIRKLEGL